LRCFNKKFITFTSEKVYFSYKLFINHYKINLMKKSLLIATALLGASSLFAQGVGIDPSVYEPQTSGDVKFTLTNRWLYSNNLKGYAGAGSVGDPLPEVSWATGNNGMRTATIYNDLVLITDNTNGGFHKLNLATGEYLGFVKYSLAEAPETALDIAYTNQIGVDDFGHIYVIGYVANLTKAPIVIRTLDVKTGVLTKVGEINAAGETYVKDAPRTDYYHIIGDVTGKEAKAQFCCAIANSGCEVLRATLPQGGTEWEGCFDGSFCWGEIRDFVTYPEGAVTQGWGTAPNVVLIKDEEFTGDLFYVDGFNSFPTLYDMEGQVAGSFADKPELAPEATGTNGVCEVSLAGKNFVIYSLNQYVPTAYCKIRVACFGEGTEYQDLTSFWDAPADGLGKQSDGGVRIHCLQTKVLKDNNGKQGAYILDYKVRNGIGVYVLAEEGFEDPNGAGVEGVEIDNSNEVTPVYYNLNGMQVENPENGLYIVKRGNKVTKEIVR